MGGWVVSGLRNGEMTQILRVISKSLSSMGANSPIGCIDALAQDCSNSIANALELLQCGTKPSICLFVRFSCRNYCIHVTSMCYVTSSLENKTLELMNSNLLSGCVKKICHWPGPSFSHEVWGNFSMKITILDTTLGMGDTEYGGWESQCVK